MFQHPTLSGNSGKSWLFRSKKQYDSTAFTFIKQRQSCQQTVKDFSFNDENENIMNKKKLSLKTQPFQRSQEYNPKLIHSTTIKRPFKETKAQQEVLVGEMINRQIEKDNFVSERDPFNKIQYNSYLEERSRIAVGPKFKLPSKVLQIYDQISQSQKQGGTYSEPVNFIQGCLSQVGIYYYAINNFLLLYDIKFLYDQAQGRASLNKPTQIKFDDIVLAINQVKNLNTEAFNFRQKEDFLVISFPWKLKFYAFEKRYEAFQTLDLIDLNAQVLLRCEKVLKVDYDSKGRFYYMNQKDGTLNCITFEESNSFLALRSGKYSIKNYRSKRKTGFFKTAKLAISFKQKTQICKRLQYFFRFFYNTGKSLFPCDFRIKNFFVDRLRNLVFCFDQIDQHISIIGNKRWRTISLYNISQQSSTPDFVCRVPEQRVFKEISQLWLDSDQKQAQIIDIFPMSVSNSSLANVEILLSNGILIGLYIGSNFFKFKEIQKPPCNKKFLKSIVQSQLNRSENQKNCQQVDMLHTHKENIIVARQTLNEKIVACTNSSQHIMAIRKNRNKLSGFFIQKPIRGEKYKASNVQWLGLQNPVMQNIQNYQFQQETQCHIKDFFLFQIRNSTLLNYSGRSLVAHYNENHAVIDKKYYDIQKLHPVAKQVYFPPDYFIFGSDMFIESCVRLRPIDVLFCILRYHQNRFDAEHMIYEFFLNESYKSQVPFKNPDRYEVIDILCMLTQIYSDHQGRYFQGNQIIRKIGNSQKSNILRSQKIQQSSCQAGGKFICYQQLSKDFLETILEIIQAVSKKQGEIRVKRIPNRYSTAKRAKIGLAKSINQQFSEKVITEVSYITIDFLRVHLSRILRLIWFSFIDEIPLNFNQNISRKLLDFKIVAYRILFLKLSEKFVIDQSESVDLQAWESYDLASKQQSVRIITNNFLTVLNKSMEFLKYLKVITNIHSVFKRSFDPINKKINVVKFTFQDIFDKNKNKPEFWERPCFETYLRQENKQQLIKEWYQMFPSFLSDNFRKVIRIYLETINQTDEDILIEKLKSIPEDSYLPQYFLDYLTQTRRFRKLKFYFNPPKQLVKQQSIRNQVNQQMSITPNLVTNYADAVASLQNIRNSPKSIRQKRLLLSQLQSVIYDLQRTENTNNYKFQDIFIQIKAIKDILSMQEIIKQHFLKIMHIRKSKAKKFIKIFSQKQSLSKTEEQMHNQMFTQKLEYQTLERKSLQQIVRVFDQQQLSIVYYGLFQNESKTKLQQKITSFITRKQKETQNEVEWPQCIKQPLLQILPKAKYRISVIFLIKCLSQFELEKKYMTRHNLQQLIKYLDTKKSTNLSIGQRKDSWYDKMSKKFSWFSSQENEFSGKKMLQKLWIPQFLYGVGYKSKDIGINLLQLLETSFENFLEQEVSQFNEQNNQTIQKSILKTYSMSKAYVYYFLNAFIFVKQLYPKLRKDFFTIAQRHINRLSRQNQINDTQKQDYLQRFNYQWNKKKIKQKIFDKSSQQSIIKLQKQTFQAMKKLVDIFKFQFSD